MNTSLIWLFTHTHTRAHTHTYIYICISWLCIYIYIYIYIYILQNLVFDHSHKNGKTYVYDLTQWYIVRILDMTACQQFFLSLTYDTLLAVFPFFDTWKLVNRFSFSLTHETLSAVFCPNCLFVMFFWKVVKCL